MKKSDFIRQVYFTDENNQMEMYTEGNKMSFSASDIKELRDKYIIVETNKEIVYILLDSILSIVIYKQTKENKENK